MVSYHALGQHLEIILRALRVLRDMTWSAFEEHLEHLKGHALGQQTSAQCNRCHLIQNRGNSQIVRQLI